MSNARASIEEEREYLKLFDRLNDRQLQSIVQVGSDFAQAAKVHKAAQEEKAKTEQYAREVEDYNKKLPQETEQYKEKLEKDNERVVELLAKKRVDEEKRTSLYKAELKKALEADIATLADKQRSKLELRRNLLKEYDSEMEKELDLIKNKHKEEEKRLLREYDEKKKLISHSLAEERRVQMEMAEFQHQQKMKQLQAMRDDQLQRALALEGQAQEGEKQRLNVQLEGITNFFSGESGRTRMRNVLGVVAGSLAVLYGFKVVSPLATQGLKRYLFRPQLVNKYYKNSALGTLLRQGSADSPNVILPKELQMRVDMISAGTRNTSLRNGLFGHMMLYGQPGTGKTLFAEQLARESKMDFAMMSGPSFDQFSARDAIVEIKKLFSWANTSRNGLLLFIDECDSFLEDRTTLSPDRVRVLNEFINQTGTESRKFMLVFETNRPSVLDPAVHSRITRSVHFLPPEEEEVRLLLKQYIDRYIVNEKPHVPFWRSVWQTVTGRKPRRISYEGLTDDVVEKMAVKMHEMQFVGRDISNTIIAMTQAAYASPTFAITEDLALRVVDEQVDKKLQERTAYSSFSAHREL
mmetsp:Transcript_15679/g.61240  ORF Transcript_15679/g.61240 Transcript_15679/m.61240 type:complete len:580 (+) Transcript_15679:74-1813(+)